MSEYGCKHEVWLDKDPDGIPAVVLRNDLDPHYKQYFTDSSKLLKFIVRLFRLWLELSSYDP